MFEIKNKVIKITKGDSAALKVNLKKNDGSDYVMKSGDTLTITVRKKVGSPVLMQITSTSNIIDMKPADTKNLEAGECCFDIELTTSAGDVFTVVGLTDNMVSNMTVWKEVTE